jgi:hypothetical protein
MCRQPKMKHSPTIFWAKQILATDLLQPWNRKNKQRNMEEK